MADRKSPFIHSFIHFPVIWLPIDVFKLDIAPYWFALCFLEDHFFSCYGWNMLLNMLLNVFH